MLSPPQLCQPGQPFLLQFEAYSYEGGILVDPLSVQLDITFGGYVQLVPDYAGTFVYTGADPTMAGPGVLWRTGAGQYSFQWQVPADIPAGVYTANWTWVYGPDNDVFLAAENFVVPEGGPFGIIPPVDVGFWTGSLSYQPAWSPEPFVIPFGSVDANGVAWMLLSVTGWDGPPTVGQIIQRSADHGGWPSAQFYGPRLLTLDVMISAPSQAARDVAKQQLIQACPVSDLATFAYGEPVPKQCYVRQNGSANITFKSSTLADIEATIPLVAPDPRKYSTIPLTATATLPAPVINPLTLPITLPAQFPESAPPVATAVTCINEGTFETRPIVTVTGPVTSPGIVNAVTGQTITWTGLTLAASDQLIISTDARQAFLNDAFCPADVTSAWWVMSPGETQIFLTGDTFTGGSQLSVAWSSAWALYGVRERPASHAGRSLRGHVDKSGCAVLG